MNIRPLLLGSTVLALLLGCDRTSGAFETGASGVGVAADEDDDPPRPPPPHGPRPGSPEMLRHMLECKDPPPRHAGHRRPPFMKDLVLAYDTSGDGELDETERAALEADMRAGCEARRARLVAACDADEDGVISDAELEVMGRSIHEEMERRRAGFEATFDANGDGHLDEAERAALHGALEDRLARFDANGDGQLDPSERAALREALRAKLLSGEPPGPL